MKKRRTIEETLAMMQPGDKYEAYIRSRWCDRCGLMGVVHSGNVEAYCTCPNASVARARDAEWRSIHERTPSDRWLERYG